MAPNAFKNHQEKMRIFDKEVKASRQISRNAIYRIVLLSSAIVGFSVSLFSIPSLQEGLNLCAVKYSWYSFIVVIILGSLIMLAEGRIRHGKTWKGIQSSQWVNALSDYSFKEKFLAFLIVGLTIFHPANLVFNKVYQEETEKLFKQRVNGLVIHRLARLSQSLALLENVIFIFFILGLVLMVKSFVF